MYTPNQPAAALRYECVILIHIFKLRLSNVFVNWVFLHSISCQSHNIAYFHCLQHTYVYKINILIGFMYNIVASLVYTLSPSYILWNTHRADSQRFHTRISANTKNVCWYTCYTQKSTSSFSNIIGIWYKIMKLSTEEHNNPTWS